jgi:hypothetical protein
MEEEGQARSVMTIQMTGMGARQDVNLWLPGGLGFMSCFMFQFAKQSLDMVSWKELKNAMTQTLLIAMVAQRQWGLSLDGTVQKSIQFAKQFVEMEYVWLKSSVITEIVRMETDMGLSV